MSPDGQNMDLLLASLSLLTKSAEYLGPAFAQLILNAQNTEKQRIEFDQIQQKQLQERRIQQQQENLCSLLSQSIVDHLKSCNQSELHQQQTFQHEQMQEILELQNRKQEQESQQGQHNHEIQKLPSHVQKIEQLKINQDIRNIVTLEENTDKKHGNEKEDKDYLQVAKSFQQQLQDAYKQHVLYQPEYVVDQSFTIQPTKSMDHAQLESSVNSDALTDKIMEPEVTLSLCAALPIGKKVALTPEDKANAQERNLLSLMELRKNYENVLQKYAVADQVEAENEKMQKETNDNSRNESCVDNKLLYLASIASMTDNTIDFSSPVYNNSNLCDEPVGTVALIQPDQHSSSNDYFENRMNYCLSQLASSNDSAMRRNRIPSSSNDSSDPTSNIGMEKNSKRHIINSGKGPMRKRMKGNTVHFDKDI